MGVKHREIRQKKARKDLKNEETVDETGLDKGLDLSTAGLREVLLGDLAVLLDPQARILDVEDARKLVDRGALKKYYCSCLKTAENA